MKKLIKLLTKLLTVIVALGIISPTFLSAQESRKGFGVELDALPYITGGYYGSVWYGQNQWRVRGIISKINLPDFITEDGFEDATTTAYTVIIDRFIGARANRQEGLWVGAGFEFWRNSINREGYSQSEDYDSYIATVGAGYVIPISGRLYINPWLAGHYRFAGDDEVPVSGATYKPKTFLPELSVKLGWRF